MQISSKSKIIRIVFSLLTGLVVLSLGACATSAPARSDENRILIYGFVRATDSGANISTISIDGVTDSGKRVAYNARHDRRGFYYVADIEPGRYTLTQVVFAVPRGTVTYYIAGKAPVFRTKSEVRNGIDVAPGKVAYFGTLNMILFKDDKGRDLFRPELTLDPPEAEALYYLSKTILEGPWADAIQQQLQAL